MSASSSRRQGPTRQRPTEVASGKATTKPNVGQLEQGLKDRSGKAKGQVAAKAKAKGGAGGNAFDLSDGAKAKDFSKRGQASLGNRGAKDFRGRADGKVARSAVVADTMSTVVAGGRRTITSAVEVVAESMSAAAAAAVAVVADAAEAAAAAAGDVPTSISSRTSSRSCGSTTVSNSIASATGTAIPRSMWASWRRTCRRSNQAQFGAHATDICGSTTI